VGRKRSSASIGTAINSSFKNESSHPHGRDEVVR
jgi:hypothetical protein